MNRLAASLLFALAATACTNENAPCQRDSECAKKNICYIVPVCQAAIDCYGSCRTSCTAENLTCPRDRHCECGLLGVPDGGCACLNNDGGIPDAG